MGKYSVTRDGLGSPRSSFRTRIPSQTMPKAPTCPPNATVQAEFQNRNVKEMLRSENNEPEEIMIRKQYPLLASIIIRDQKCKYPMIWSYGPYVKCRLNSGIFRNFEFSIWNLNLNSLD